MNIGALPAYDSLDLSPEPPLYTSSVHHISLVYYNDESKCTGKVSFIPLVFEINSTQINLYHVKPEYTRLTAHFFNDLHTAFVDPNLNFKSKNASKFNVIGQGVGSSTSSFTLPDNMLFNSIPSITPPPPSLPINSVSNMFYSNSNSSNNYIGKSVSLNSSYASTSSYSCSRNSTKTSFSKLFDKLSLKRSNNNETNFNSIMLSSEERKSQDYSYINKLLNYRPDINLILDPDYTPEEAQLINFKSHIFKSFSLQELIKFGNASDFHLKPFTLRMIFPHEQFICVSYNANVYASLFYKLNIAKELSLDLDLRVSCPLDFCVPRRSRARNRRNRSRSIPSSIISSKSQNNNETPVSRTTTRSRSNSLLADDDDDEFDTTFNIDQQEELDYQPQQSIQPQIILEDEILDDIIQLEPAQHVMSTLSTVSRVTTSSVFSSVERSLTSATDMSMMSSLSPISSESDLPHVEASTFEKVPFDSHPHDKYKELVFAIKCIRSCKNKTKPWVN